MSTSIKNSNAKLSTVLMIAILVLLVAFPLVYNSGAEFSGADDAASEAISEMNKDARPWFEPIWSPPSGEIESMLFALQAAIGAGVIGYFFGFKNGERQSYRSGRRFGQGDAEGTVRSEERTIETY